MSIASRELWNKAERALSLLALAAPTGDDIRDYVIVLALRPCLYIYIHIYMHPQRLDAHEHGCARHRARMRSTAGRRRPAEALWRHPAGVHTTRAWAVARRDANASMNASSRATSWVTKSSDPTVLLPKRVIAGRAARRRTPRLIGPIPIPSPKSRVVVSAPETEPDTTETDKSFNAISSPGRPLSGPRNRTRYVDSNHG